MYRDTFLYKLYKRFIKLRGEPRTIALGFALGLFVGMSPTIGVQTAIAVFLAVIFGWNKISAAIGVWITNPVTAPVIYSITYFSGAKILGVGHNYAPSEDLTLSALEKILNKAPDVLWALILGGVIIGFFLAVAGYYISYFAIIRYQERIKARLVKRRERLAQKRIERAKRKALKEHKSN